MFAVSFDFAEWLKNQGHLSHAEFQRNVHAAIELYELCGALGPPSCLQPWEMLPPLHVAKATPPGAFVEVGVFQGGFGFMLSRLAERQGRDCFLYDTFEGLADFTQDIDELALGFLVADEATVRKALGAYPTVVKGVFPNVSPIPERVAFAAIDVDQYKSTKETILALKDRMIPGGVMWFDDSNKLKGARQAVREVFESWEIDSSTGRWFLRF